jgi:hypothetical protein
MSRVLGAWQTLEALPGVLQLPELQPFAASNVNCIKGMIALQSPGNIRQVRPQVKFAGEASTISLQACCCADTWCCTAYQHLCGSSHAMRLIRPLL